MPGDLGSGGREGGESHDTVTVDARHTQRRGRADAAESLGSILTVLAHPLLLVVLLVVLLLVLLLVRAVSSAASSAASGGSREHQCAGHRA